MRKRSVAEIRSADFRQQPPDIQTPELPASAHQIHEYLHLAAALGANPEPLRRNCSSRRRKLKPRRKNLGWRKSRSPIFGLNPGAEYGPAKRWPVERFIAAAKEIQQRTNCVWLIFGGKGDVPIANQIESAIRNSAIRNSESGRPDFAPRTDVAPETLPRAVDQRFRPDARRRRAGHAGRRAVRQHVAGIDRAGSAGRSAPSAAEIRRAVFAVFSARMPD